MWSTVGGTIDRKAPPISGTWDIFGPTQGALERRYGRPSSRFVTVGGVRVHLLDEGRADGPVVVLLSAHWANFTMWDGWLSHLRDGYRVLVVDLPGHGLTGQFLDGDYSIENYTRLLLGVLDTLGVRRFAVVGTSFSGVIAFRYAASEGHRLTAMILANASGIPRQNNAGPAPNAPPPQRLYRWLMPYWRPPGFFRWKLGTLLLDPTRLSPARLRQFADMNNRRGRLREAELRTGAYTSGDTRAILGRVRVPTLIQWSTHSTYLAAAEAGLFQAWMPHAPTEVILYPHVGHLMVLDAPDTTGRDARAFLDRTVSV